MQPADDRQTSTNLVELAEKVATEAADGYPGATVDAIDKLLWELHELRRQKVTEHVRRSRKLMAELDEKYGPLQ